MLNSVQKLKAAPGCTNGPPSWRQDFFSFDDSLLFSKFLAIFLPFLVEPLV